MYGQSFNRRLSRIRPSKTGGLPVNPHDYNHHEPANNPPNNGSWHVNPRNPLRVAKKGYFGKFRTYKSKKSKKKKKTLMSLEIHSVSLSLSQFLGLTRRHSSSLLARRGHLHHIAQVNYLSYFYKYLLNAPHFALLMSF